LHEIAGRERLRSRCDCVLDATPHSLLSARPSFAAMKPGRSWSTCRAGRSIDPGSAAARLRSGRLGGAGLDVFANEPLATHRPTGSSRLFDMDKRAS